jgi:chaperonin GroES
MQIKPLGDKIVLKPISEEEKTESGIILPDTIEKEKPEQGEVIAVGPGKPLENGGRAIMEIKAGNKVLFKKYSPDEFEVGKEKFLVVSQEDILGVIE